MRFVDGTATHVGTGGYVDWRKRRLLVTNDHVAQKVNDHSLARKCFDSPDYIHINNPFQAVGAPQDVAASPVDDSWNAVTHGAMTFPDYRFEKKHEPVLALAHHARLPINLCSDALRYLRDPAGVPCFGYYQVNDLIEIRPAEVPLHCVSIEANPQTGLILGYAEYFAIHRVVACLGRGYTGEQVNMTYAIDPRTGERLNLTVRLGFCESEIEAIYDYKMMRDGAIEEIFDKLMPSVMKRQFERERDRVIKEAVMHAFANCGAQQGEILTEEQKKKLPSLVLEKLKPFILHHMARPQLSPWNAEEN